MGSSEKTEYCAFTKAVEHLGDRWSLLIVRELALFGPQGFNTLATGLPGHISRSVLTEKLRKLEEIGIVAREPSITRSAPYCLTPAGEQLMPTLKSLWAWAEHWIPEDPATAQRDPTLILWWLRHRIDARALLERQVAVEFALPLADADRQWLLLAAGVEPELCQEDPMIGEDRYVYVEADAAALYPIARGTRSWADAIADHSVRLYGEPTLVAGLPGWFLPVERDEDAWSHMSLREPELAIEAAG
ncbi:MAG TPA: winged helix-turn-helix transcriptional regulator [Candidatus Limnocylindrales bacterium]|jgi:DNA-binding HxlR family transcriptional regulator|nr:winged helix-turn-helix transcriptional regulator [Candidatus Limnocylindrales bacterium]